MRNTALIVLLPLVPLAPACGQCDWVIGPHQGVPGPGASVLTRFDPDGPGPLPLQLVAGGEFLTAGTGPAHRIAIYDGEMWAPLGVGVGGPVSALAVYAGDLIAAGDFFTAGGQPATRIARWNGTSWAPLGNGVNGPVTALAVHDGELFVGGSFTSAGGAPAANIARWNGSAWNPVGSGIGGTPALITAMTSFEGFLYVVGEFTSAGGLAVGNIARWNGAWSTPGSTNGRVRAVDAHRPPAAPGTLYISGDFTTVRGVPANFVARYSALNDQWSAMGDGLPSPGREALLVRSTSSFTHEVIASTFSGEGRLLRWTGSAWNQLGPGFTFTPSTSVTFHNAQYITTANGVRFFDTPNNAWVPLGPGISDDVRDVLAFGDDLFFAGIFTTISNQRVNGVARWDGTAFFPMAGGINGFAGALAAFQDSLYVGGNFTSAGTTFANSIARWTGSGWEDAGAGLPAGVSVLDLTVHQDQLYASVFNPPSGSRVRRWTGITWEQVGSLGVAPSVLRSYAGTLFAGGDAALITSGGLSSPLARLNPATGSWVMVLVPTASSGPRILDMEVFGGSLYIAGHSLGSVPQPTRFFPIIRLDAPTAEPQIVTEVHLITVGTTSIVRSMAVYQGALHISGTFDSIGTAGATGFARFDGTSWTALGGGIPHNTSSLAPREAMTVFGDELIIAGDLSRVGPNLISNKWARWRCEPALPQCYANCDGSTQQPTLNVADFGCFLQKFAAGHTYANCDGSTQEPTLNVADFGCFLQKFAAGCN